MNRFVMMDKKDMVATALVDLKAGEFAVVSTTNNELVCEIQASEDIPYGNKIALKAIGVDEEVIKYGAVIGITTAAIQQGDLVHVHNVRSQVVDIPPVFKEEIMKQMRIVKKEG